MLMLWKYNCNAIYFVRVQAKYCVQKHIYSCPFTFCLQTELSWKRHHWTFHRSPLVIVLNKLPSSLTVFTLLPQIQSRSKAELGEWTALSSCLQCGFPTCNLHSAAADKWQEERPSWVRSMNHLCYGLPAISSVGSSAHTETLQNGLQERHAAL